MAQTGELKTFQTIESGAKLPAIAPTTSPTRPKKGLSVFDFIIRLCALVTSVAAAASMATTEQDLPFFSQFLQFQAGYDDFTTFSFFVVANAIICGYLVLSLPISIIAIIRPHADGIRVLLLILDTVMLTFTTAAASASADTVYLANYGNPSTNWTEICSQYDEFCQGVTGATVACFISVVLFMALITMSAIALRQR
uniref:CASP-like protein n=1 Tax=Kalanchoe fedtschenkoi TaxID=63787 RepID=A0A7N0U0X4_KALFE